MSKDSWQRRQRRLEEVHFESDWQGDIGANGQRNDAVRDFLIWHDLSPVGSATLWLLLLLNKVKYLKHATKHQQHPTME